MITKVYNVTCAEIYESAKLYGTENDFPDKKKQAKHNWDNPDQKAPMLDSPQEPKAKL